MKKIRKILIISSITLMCKSITLSEKDKAFYKSYYMNCIEYHELDIKNFNDSKYNSCLADAILNNKKKLIDHILSQKPNVNYPDRNGFTPLYYAAFFGEIELMDKLINMGANKNLAFNGSNIQDIYNKIYLEKDNEPYLEENTLGLVKPSPKVHLQLGNTYPQKYKDSKLKRKVLLKLKIFKNGRIDSIQVLNTAIEQDFIDSALTIVSRTTFSPGVYKNKNVNCYHTIPINFSMNEDED
ncbi:TonB family protein [Leptospira paudalimensis]|uniref:TonB family protein n=1 Tax=Leptospira paudalimensis TaxID=2950024 RepID=A0ABT3M594_9LEPT|nr:TonB family protein [Leptospira paudalimensis]MCW7503538.1 TonB family protein [Leptospira paudalimensis]